MNRLSHSASPYLLQHKDNPVEWFPWGEEAFEKARLEQKPIFLSIGYSTCHWCHVMAHESFENRATAQLMNTHFVNVKVDREERPDVDRIYMAYVQALTGSGGWPMSVWLTPELKPFFGGTYFPPEDRSDQTGGRGRAGFPSVLLQIAQLWSQSRAKIEQEAARSLAALQEIPAAAARDSSDLGDSLKKAAEYFLRIHDAEWGGFGSAPKFPRPSVLFFLTRHAQGTSRPPDAQHVLDMVLGTLDRMAGGGIHDHLGGGFHRYSVDRAWHVPHFEKMLYDQAQLAIAYLEAWQITGEEKYAEVVRGIFGYVLRDMTSPEGGFYCAEDADSLLRHGSKEHAEGAYFVWTREEIDGALDPVAAGIFCEYYGVGPHGNVDPASDPQGEFVKKNILTTLGAHAERFPLKAASSRLGMSEKVVAASLESSRRILLNLRSLRPRPHLDDKILCAWNGLMISALARAGGAMAEPLFLAAAEKAATFLRARLADPLSGELRRSRRGEMMLETGFAEDYAFLIQGLLDLYEATGDLGWLQWANDLQTIMDRLFWDPVEGGYFSSPEGDPHLLVRLKDDYDGAEPSANSVAALNLLRFFRMLGDREAGDKANRIFTHSARTLRSMPAALPQLLVALSYHLAPGRQVVVAGTPGASDTEALLQVARRRFHPDQVLLLADGAKGQAWLSERVPLLGEMMPVEGRAALYCCENFSCSSPVTDPAWLD